MSGAGTPLLALIDRFARRPVAVLGDLVVDEFVYGDIARVSREAPVLILEQRETVVVPGGGGNAVANLRALGANPLPVGVVGRDSAGDGLLRAFADVGIATAGVLPIEGYATPTKSRVLAGGVHTRRQQVVRVDRGAPRGELAPAHAAAVRSRLARALRRAEGLLIADYGYGAGSPRIAEEAAAASVGRGLPVTVDSRARSVEFHGLTACTPNQEELELALGLDPIREDVAVERAARRLLRRTSHRAVVVTRGAKGMVVLEGRRRTITVPAYGSDEVADVTGAGDTVIATFTLALIAGGTIEQAARLANYAAGLVVMKAGTATVSPDELRHAVREDVGA